MSDDSSARTPDYIDENVIAGEIRRLRTMAGLSQNQLARQISFSREYVSRAERPGHGLPSAELVAAIDDALTAGGLLIATRAAAHRNRLARRRHNRGVKSPETVNDTERPGLASETATSEKPHGNEAARLSSAALLARFDVDVDPLTLDDIEERVDELAKGYFQTTPEQFRAEVVALRRRVQTLLDSPTKEGRRTIYASLAVLTAMLAESAFATGGDTDVHCLAAMALASEAGHAELIGWIRGTQAQIALHTGNPVAAARYAVSGQSSPRGSAAAVRASTYLARASARAGDGWTARYAWRAAEDAWAQLDGSLSPSVFSLTPSYLTCCELTMRAWLGDASTVRSLSDDNVSVPTVGRAIREIDIALIRVLDDDVDEAVQAGHRALSIGESRWTVPLQDRFSGLAETLSAYRLPAVEQLRKRWQWISA